MTITPDDVAEALLIWHKVEIYGKDSPLNANDLINWADAHKGDVEFDGKYTDNFTLIINEIYYWPKNTNANEVYQDAMDFINQLSEGATEVALKPLGSSDPWEIWFD